MAPFLNSIFSKRNKNPQKALVNANSRVAFNTQELPLPMKSPYSVVTEPKKHRGPASAPGGGGFRPSNRIGSTYENLAQHQNPHRPHPIARDRRVDEFDALLRPRPAAHNQHRYYDRREHAVDYDREPSPVENYRRGRRDESCEDSEGDSDSEASMDEFYRTRYEMRIKDMKRRCKKMIRESDRDAKHYKAQCKYLVKENMMLRSQYTQLFSAYEDLKSRYMCLEASRQSSVTPSDPCSVTGVREALCSMSEINGPTAMPTRLPPLFDANGNEEDTDQDEVKVFRDREEERVEEARRETHSPLDLRAHLDVSALPLKLEDDGYSTLNNVLEQQQQQVVHKRDQTVRFDGAEEDEEESSDEFEEAILAAPPLLQEPADTDLPFGAPLKRSWSDPTLNSTGVREEDVKLVVVSPRRSRRTSRKEDYSSCYSSDDETVRNIIDRQLTHKGDLVQYKPPRPNFTSLSRRIYRRFGPNERKALAQFDYLQALSSTDGSGIECEDQQKYST